MWRAGIIALVLGVSMGGATGPAAASPEPGSDPVVSPDGPEAVRVYFTEDEALVKVFDKADRIDALVWTPTPEQRTELENRLGAHLPEEQFPVWRGRRGDGDLGWALVLEEKGRFKPITFMVHVRPDRSVGHVLVMVYRESRGDGVRRQRFLKQFRDRDLEDRLRLNRDIIGLTGATLSSRALTYGVRKALVLVDVFAGGNP